ncbi:MAG: CbiX/SirB N-terminal domain-containing protein [Paludisphaera borealis]|uniref:sirohydrochlorin chelatase n=1 Tax=Paludisphaera borealis TaxID=1387353 RepID=UPI00284E3AFA|nr:CbiX/SirB N-terminal domain-containing protein [Paludisphaera borealis]MDR3618970.1 CbiX/SirB N-terminal domain-containing protein [Paludisphaera borealis]
MNPVPVDPTAILLIAHGSRHQPANDDLHAMAARLSAGGRHAIVEACFLELAEPDIPTGGDRCVARGARRVLLIPYFLSAGVHLLRDLTAARDALAVAHPKVEFLLGAPLGPHLLLDQLVEVRIDEIGRNVGAVTASAQENADRYRPMGDRMEGSG